MLETLKVKPKYIPMMCPVCKGHTTVNYGKFICRACGGKGYIPVPPEEGEEVYDGGRK